MQKAKQSEDIDKFLLKLIGASSKRINIPYGMGICNKYLRIDDIMAFVRSNLAIISNWCSMERPHNRSRRTLFETKRVGNLDSSSVKARDDATQNRLKRSDNHRQ